MLCTTSLQILRKLSPKKLRTADEHYLKVTLLTNWKKSSKDLTQTLRSIWPFS